MHVCVHVCVLCEMECETHGGGWGGLDKDGWRLASVYPTIPGVASCTE